MLKIYKKIILLFIVVLFLFSCSPTNRLLKKHQYSEVIKQATDRIYNDPEDKSAEKLLKKSYSLALVYYQNEIDRPPKTDVPFSSTKTLDNLLAVKSISDRIQKNPYARKMVGELKNYDQQIAETKQLALRELYDAGTNSLTAGTVEKAKEAFHYFRKVVDLEPEYKDARQKLVEAKNIASLKVVVDSVHLDSPLGIYIPDKFYENMIYELKYNLLDRDFFEFYTPAEAIEMQIDHPDMFVSVNIEEFKINSVLANNGMYASADNTQQRYVLNATGALMVKVVSAETNVQLFKQRINCQEYVDKKSDSYGNLRTELRNNPESQRIFDTLFMSNTSQITDRLSVYFSTIH
ncbi:MAG: hypothetical protein WC384_20430 [Prolixibacteraceae bacterium]|jgi:hypothetical protein